MIATDAMVQEAVDYLLKTNGEHARIKAEYNAKSALTKTVLGFRFNDEEGTVEKKKAKSYTSAEYQSHIEALKVLEIELHTMYNKRDTYNTIIDLYRTECANSRRPNI